MADEDPAHGADVAHLGDVLQEDGLVGEQRGADVGQRGVLGPRDADRALEGPAADDADLFHAFESSPDAPLRLGAERLSRAAWRRSRAGCPAGRAAHARTRSRPPAACAATASPIAPRPPRPPPRRPGGSTRGRPPTQAARRARATPSGGHERAARLVVAHLGREVAPLRRGHVGRVADHEVERPRQAPRTASSRSPLHGSATRPARPRRARSRARRPARPRRRPWRCTTASGRSAASESAMQPLPVPTSTTTRRASSPRSSSRRGFDQDLGLRPRDEHVGRDQELVAPEGLGAGQVLERAAAARAARPGRTKRGLVAPADSALAAAGEDRRRGPSRGRGAAAARRPAAAWRRRRRGRRAAAPRRAPRSTVTAGAQTGCLQLLRLVVGDQARSRPRRGRRPARPAGGAG